MRVGMGNIIVNIHRNQMSTKYFTSCYQTTVHMQLFWKSCSRDLAKLKAVWKTKIFWLTYQPHSSSADCAKELFKPSKIRQVYKFAMKKKFWLWILFSILWVTS